MMKSKELRNLGIPKGPVMETAKSIVGRAIKDGMPRPDIREAIRNLVNDPSAYETDPLFKDLALQFTAVSRARARFEERAEPAPYRQWGNGLESQAVEQMVNACLLPVSIRGALMPDAHVGYGLPIGGVLAVDNAVIPYAVGMDIACRMKLTVLDIPVADLKGQKDRLIQALEKETRFGVGASFKKNRREHPVMDEGWDQTPMLAHLKDKAWNQLGTSGSGNHFVEYGTLTLDKDDLGLEAGIYTALLSHSGSRGPGGMIAQHYSKLAMSMHPELPGQLQALSWFDLDSAEGREYWISMEQMGRFAAANHELIHRHIARHLGVDILLDLENHHNYAWREQVDGRELVVHRKGATPAGPGVIGIIPGSMGTPGYVVRGKGDMDSLQSASHGAGRKLSRKAAKETITWHQTKKFLADRDVLLITAGLDESPLAYKDIDDVMAAQDDLVERVARFDPKIVKMAPAGERPED